MADLERLEETQQFRQTSSVDDERIDHLLQRYSDGQLDAAGAYSLAGLLRGAGRDDQAELVASWAKRRYEIEHPPPIARWYRQPVSTKQVIVGLVVAGVLAVLLQVIRAASELSDIFPL